MALTPIEESKSLSVSSPNEIVEFVERMYGDNSPTLKECFSMATDMTMYMTAIRDKSLVLGSMYVPGTINAIGKRALTGDVEAAKLLLEYMGIKVKATVVNNPTQVNVINVPTLKDIFEPAEVIDVQGE